MNRSWNGGLMRFVGFAVAVTAFLIAAVLAVLLVGAMVVTGAVASALIALSALAMRARRTVRTRSQTPGVIEARKVGHTWVAYGWSERR